MKRITFSYLKSTALIIQVFIFGVAISKAQTVTAFATGLASAPSSMTTDAAGNLFVVDQTANITKYTPSGIKSTFKTITSGKLTSIGIDPSGNFYVSDFNSFNTVKITPTGQVSTFLTLSSGAFGSPLAFDYKGNLYLFNLFTNKISKVSPTGTVSIFSTIASPAQGLVFDKAGNMFAACNLATNQPTLYKVSPSGTITNFSTVEYGTAGMTIDVSGNLYYTDLNASTVTKVTPAGVTSIFASTGLNQTQAIACSGNFIYVSNKGDNSISKISTSGLPVMIVSFDAKAKDRTIQTVWQTSAEINTSHFIIQHSLDGINFTDIGTVKANGNEANRYSFTHKILTNGINYYRLESVEKDGKITYSKIVSVNVSNVNLNIFISPNPAKDYTTIFFSDVVNHGTITVFDITGKELIKQSINTMSTKLNLNTHALTKGNYIVKIDSDKGIFSRQLLVK